MRENGDFFLKTGIIGFGSPILAKKSEKVTDFDQNLAETLRFMKEVMKSTNGVGLAAPQLRFDLAAFVYDWQGASGELCNPVVRRMSASKTLGDEGCLSSPGTTLEVPRAHRVRVSGQDRDGQHVEITAAGYLARILQHEMDHLEGVCIVSRLKRPERRILERTLRKDSLPHSSGTGQSQSN